MFHKSQQIDGIGPTKRANSRVEGPPLNILPLAETPEHKLGRIFAGLSVPTVYIAEEAISYARRFQQSRSQHFCIISNKGSEMVIQTRKVNTLL